jgi:hypothetical protein
MNHKKLRVQLENHADKGQRYDDRADGDILHGPVHRAVEVGNPSLGSGEGGDFRKVEGQGHREQQSYKVVTK